MEKDKQHFWDGLAGPTRSCETCKQYHFIVHVGWQCRHTFFNTCWTNEHKEWEWNGDYLKW